MPLKKPHHAQAELHTMVQSTPLLATSRWSVYKSAKAVPAEYHKPSADHLPSKGAAPQPVHLGQTPV